MTNDAWRPDVIAPRLARLARSPLSWSPHTTAGASPDAPAAAPAQSARCELCSAVVEAGHPHLLDLEMRRLLCACRACALLFSERAAAGRYRLVPTRVRLVTDFDLDDASWDALAIPVDMTFFFFDTAVRRVVALYPSPAGATESRLPLEAWSTLVARNAALAELQPDVEALLVNRARGARDYWLVPVDVCYALVGLIRAHWNGIGGGDAVWREMDRFFDGLRGRAVRVRRDGGGPLISTLEGDAP